jgi:excisionase family DNA binding protein
MNTAELAKKVGCHPDTIRAMVHRRYIDATPVGGRTGYLFDDETALAAVREILKARRVMQSNAAIKRGAM